jgi:hypothetical protein
MSTVDEMGSTLTDASIAWLNRELIVRRVVATKGTEEDDWRGSQRVNGYGQRGGSNSVQNSTRKA